MPPKSGARDIGSDKEKAPRVHPQMVVFTSGARKGVEIPFVMGVMADLSGNPKAKLPSVAKREFLDIDSGNFDQQMKAARPRVAFPVKSTLPGAEGELAVDLEFESLDDFKPERVARKVEPLRRLLEERDRLKNLAANLDGNADGADAIEEIIAKLKAMTKKP